MIEIDCIMASFSVIIVCVAIFRLEKERDFYHRRLTLLERRVDRMATDLINMKYNIKVDDGNL